MLFQTLIINFSSRRRRSKHELEAVVATTSPPVESVDEGKAAAARVKRPRAAAASASTTAAAAAAVSSSGKGKGTGGDGGGGGRGAKQAVRMRASAQADLKAVQANVKRLREQECEKIGRFTPKLEAVAAKYRELVAELRAAPAEPDGTGRVTRAGVVVEVDGQVLGARGGHPKVADFLGGGRGAGAEAGAAERRGPRAL